MGNFLPYCRHCQYEMMIIFEYGRDPNLGELSLYANNQDWQLELVLYQVLIDVGNVIESCGRRLLDLDCDCLIRNASVLLFKEYLDKTLLLLQAYYVYNRISWPTKLGYNIKLTLL